MCRCMGTKARVVEGNLYCSVWKRNLSWVPMYISTTSGREHIFRQVKLNVIYVRVEIRIKKPTKCAKRQQYAATTASLQNN